MLSIIYNFALDSDRKSLFSIYRDLSSLKKRNFSTKSYFTNLMFKKSSGNIQHYIDHKVYLKMAKEYYRPNGKNFLLEDKIGFQEYLIKEKISGTHLIAKLRNKTLMIGRDQFTDPISIESKIKELATSYESIFIKRTDTSGGQDIIKLNKGDDFNITSISLANDYIIEQTLVQHATLSKINPNSINTLRVVTFKIGEKVVIPNCMFRMGIGTSYLDNASSGGIFISYDLANNKLGSTAYQLFKNGAKSFTKHPVSDFVFENSSLPFNEEIKTLVTKAAIAFKDIESIGWDIAFTKDGPVIVEGNDSPHMVMMQISSQGLLNCNIYKKVFKKYFKTS